MASVVVIDSGVFLAGVLEEPLADKANALLKQLLAENIQIAAPVLFQYEIVAVTRKAVFQKRLTIEESIKARDFILAYGMMFHHDDSLLKRAYDLATELNRPTAYDTQYLAVAERLNCDFWTADERLFNAASSQLAWVKWVGNFAHSPES